MAFDQFDNADQLVRLGVARAIARGRFHARTVAEALAALTTDPAVSRSCRTVAARFDGVDALSGTCDALESLFPG